MFKIILNNPYRVLGVYSNSSKKEQVANKAKIQAFMRVHKSIQFPLDLKSLLPSVERTQDVVDTADSCLVLQEEQVRYAQFWFMKITALDDIAFNYLLSGNMDDAIAAWNKSLTISSLQNLFLCSIIKGHFNEAINSYAIPLYNNFSQDFIDIIAENFHKTNQELIQNLIDILQNEGVDLQELSSISDSSWRSYIDFKLITSLITQLNLLVANVSENKRKEAIFRLDEGKNLIVDSKSVLSKLKKIVGENDSQYQIISDKVALAVLQCCIDYFNGTDEPDAAVDALSLCEYACSIACGPAAKLNCNDNKDRLEKAIKIAPPIEVAAEAKAVKDLLEWYKKMPRTSILGLELLTKAQKPLITIKEKLGKTHPYYLEISSILGSAALDNIIEEVNEAQKENKPMPTSHSPLVKSENGKVNYKSFSQDNDYVSRRRFVYKLKNVLTNAWQTIVYIDLLDKTPEFQEKRYKPNLKTLFDIINGLHGFNIPDKNYVIWGCCRSITADKYFFWCDSEYFMSCDSKSSYQNYLKLFPNGIHTAEANNRIEDISVRKKKTWWILLVVVAVLVLIVYLLYAKYKKHSDLNEFVESTEYKINYNTICMEELHTLYISLLECGYTERQLGDENLFARRMADPLNRKNFYEFMKGRTDFIIGTYDSYEYRLTGVHPTADMCAEMELHNRKELHKLYVALLKKGYTEEVLGDEELFAKRMRSAQNRKMFYDYVKGRKDFKIGSYDIYEQRLTGVNSNSSIPKWGDDI